MDGFLGEIRAFAFNYPPKLWASCDGAELSIKQNPSLFSLIGNTYGGNGVTTFRLPDLQGRDPVGMTTNNMTYPLGAKDGVEKVTISALTMAAHGHAMNAHAGISGNFASANNAMPATVGDAGVGATIPIYAAPGTLVVLAADTIPPSGGSIQSHTNVQPSLALTFCICMQGTFPAPN